MIIKRIVSFLPSATELLFEFGVEDSIYGVTHECNYPHRAIDKPRVIESVINSEELTSKEIDTMTCQLLKDGKDIFVLNEENLKRADPDLVITQKTCEVCAAFTNQVNRAIKILDKKPIVHSMDPHSIEEILNSVTILGEILGKEKRSREITNPLRKRIQKIKKIQNKEKPKVLAIEWMDPFFTAGHWVPEMIEIAGGNNLASKPREHSRRMDFQEIADLEPDKIIIMSCGFDTKRNIIEYDNILKHNREWNSLDAVRNKQVFAVDSNSFFSKPSVRTIEGLEILSKIIQPEKFHETKVSAKAFYRFNNE